MTKRVRSCLIAAMSVLAVLLAAGFAFFYVVVRPYFNSIDLLENGRRVWIAIVAANSERVCIGKPPIWPRDLGFDHTRTATDYFRRLMADENGLPTIDYANRLAGDLSPVVLGGAGVPVAKSVTEFTERNNIWTHYCPV